LAEFSKSPGPFVDRDLYVTVYTPDGVALSHINPKMVGKNMMELRDADGKYHIRERLEAAKHAGDGWQDFKFYNPVSKKIEPKRMYWEKHDGLVFAVIVAVMAAVAVGATLYGKASRKELATLIETASAKEALAADMKSLLLEQANYMRNVGLQSEVKDMQASEDRAKQLDDAYGKAIDRMSHLQLGVDEKASLEAPFRQALALATGFHPEEAAKVITQDLDPPVQKALTELNRLIDIQKKANRAAIDEATRNGDRVALVVFAVQGVALLVSLLMAYLVTRSITGPLRSAVEVTSRVASGDLTSGIDPVGRDEAADLLRSLRAMNGGLSSMVMRIRAGSESIAVGASQVSA